MTCRCWFCGRVGLPVRPGYKHVPTPHLTVKHKVCGNPDTRASASSEANVIAMAHQNWQTEELWDL